MNRVREIADRKALLVIRAELDRARMTLSIYEVKSVVSPAPDPARIAGLRPMAATIIGIAAPLLGAGRLGRWLRAASYGVMALRIARQWRDGR